VSTAARIDSFQARVDGRIYIHVHPGRGPGAGDPGPG